MQSTTLGLLSQPTSAASLQVPGHLFQPSQSYVPTVPNTVPVQPSYAPTSQPMQPQTYSSLPTIAQQEATVLQPVLPTPAQGTSTVLQIVNMQSCPLTRQSVQPVVQANATVPQSYSPGVQQLPSTHILPPLQQAEPGQTLPPLQQAGQNLLPDQQAASLTVQHLTNVQNLQASQCSVQPVSAYIAVQHASTVQNFQEAAALQLNMQAAQREASSMQHGSPGAALIRQEDPLLTVTTQKGLHAAGMIAAGKADFKESTFITPPLQTSHIIEVPAQPVS